MIDVADREEYVLAANQLYEFRLLLVDVLELVEHHLAELRADASFDFLVPAQQIDCAAFEIVEIERAERQFTFAVEFIEPREHVKDKRSKARRVAIDSRCDQICPAHPGNR